MSYHIISSWTFLGNQYRVEELKITENVMAAKKDPTTLGEVMRMPSMSVKDKFEHSNILV